MAKISFSDARHLTERSEAWMKSLSDFIKDPVNSTVPDDIYDTQKLAFEIDITELNTLVGSSDKLLGILGYESDGSLTVVLVGTDSSYKPSSAVEPIETFPIKADMSQLNTVLNDYLTP